MEGMAHIALRAARQASQAMLRSFDRLDLVKVEHKARNDFVSQVDRDAEAVITEMLHKTYPDHAITGEELGASIAASNGSEYSWVIDPLDGTTNFLQGIPHFCISIAVMKGRHIEHAVIVDPLRNEEFVASRGQGAQLNGRRMRVSDTIRLDEAVLSTGIPPGSVGTRLDSYMNVLAHFTGTCRAVRRLGSAALDLAYVAAGRVDGFWEPGLQPWDIAAGVLLIREAGGFVGDFSGGESFMKSGDIVAANPKLFKALVQGIRAQGGIHAD
ncbi:MAG: inositol monophosphatase family protein [Pseudomonadales bacterium]